jgi:hypothetical protein
LLASHVIRIETHPDGLSQATKDSPTQVRSVVEPKQLRLFGDVYLRRELAHLWRRARAVARNEGVSGRDPRVAELVAIAAPLINEGATVDTAVTLFKTLIFRKPALPAPHGGTAAARRIRRSQRCRPRWDRR